jgi:DNA-binding NarL/FixJ family response regulator
MKTVSQQRVLIAGRDAQFRQELHNFLLSEGFQRVDSEENFNEALEKIGNRAYDVLVFDVGSPSEHGLELARRAVRLRPELKAVLVIEAEDQSGWNEMAPSAREFRFLIKSTVTRNLLPALEE